MVTARTGIDRLSSFACAEEEEENKEAEGSEALHTNPNPVEARCDGVVSCRGGPQRSDEEEREDSDTHPA